MQRGVTVYVRQMSLRAGSEQESGRCKFAEHAGGHQRRQALKIGRVDRDSRLRNATKNIDEIDAGNSCILFYVPSIIIALSHYGLSDRPNVSAWALVCRGMVDRRVRSVLSNIS